MNILYYSTYIPSTFSKNLPDTFIVVGRSIGSNEPVSGLEISVNTSEISN